MKVYAIVEQHNIDYGWPFRFMVISKDGQNLSTYSQDLKDMHLWCAEQYGQEYTIFRGTELGTWYRAANLFRFRDHYQATEFKLRWK